MKKIIALIISIYCSTSPSWAEETKPARWGYMLHSSALTDDYLEAVIPHYSVICMTGFKIGETGDIAIESAGMMNKIKSITSRHHVTMYPLVSFRSAPLGHRVLTTRKLREQTAVRLSDFARSSGFKGIHLDFEYLPPEDDEKLGEFLSTLRKAYPGTISMAVFPTIGFPEKWSRFHDLKIISSRVDEIVLMCYDYHGSHTGPGPVTDVRWAEQNIQYALGHMKPSRIWLGIPAYGYRWCNGRAAPLSARQGARLAVKHSPVRDPSGNLRFSYTDAGRFYSVYISDKKTRSLLQKLSAEHGLAGTALWRIGFEE